MLAATVTCLWTIIVWLIQTLLALQDQHAEQADADEFFLDSDGSDAAQTSPEVQPAKALMPETVHAVPAVTHVRGLQAQQQSVPAAAVGKHQQKRQHDQLGRAKALAKRAKHSHSQETPAVPKVTDDTAYCMRQHEPLLSRLQTTNTAADSDKDIDKSRRKADFHAQQLRTVIQPRASTEVPKANAGVPQADAAVLKVMQLQYAWHAHLVGSARLSHRLINYSKGSLPTQIAATSHVVCAGV